MTHFLPLKIKNCSKAVADKCINVCVFLDNVKFGLAIGASGLIIATDTSKSHAVFARKT